jgi:diacylglycerol kinase (ATP)
LSDGLPQRTAFSLHSRIKSFTFAFRGIGYLARSEHNAWLHLAATVVAFGLGAALRLSVEEWRWIGLAIALVWMAEAFNTAIERVCDVVSPEFDERIGRAKDVAAGGVLIVALFALLVGISVFVPHLT